MGNYYVLFLKKLYIINIRNLKIEKISLINKINLLSIHLDFWYRIPDEILIYNNKDNIYIYTFYCLLQIKYINNEFQIKEIFKFNKLDSINYILNKYNKLNNIRINCFPIDSIYFYFTSIYPKITWLTYHCRNFNDIIYYSPKKKAYSIKEIRLHNFEKEMKDIKK